MKKAALQRPKRIHKKSRFAAAFLVVRNSNQR
jgi:hypothetical protein